MKRNCAFATTLMLLIMMFTACAYANSIGLSYTQIIDDRAFGLTGDYQSQVNNRLSFEAELQAQAGDIYNATLKTDFILDVGVVDLKLIIENRLKGYDLETLGREQNVGLAFTVPVEQLSIDVGVGGKNASPFSAPNAINVLTDAGFAETDLVDKGLEALTPAATGIPFRNGSTINAFVTTGFMLGVFDVDVKGIVELIGEGEAMHQVNTRLKTTKNVGAVNITTALEIGLASYADVIYREVGVISTANIDF